MRWSSSALPSTRSGCSLSMTKTRLPISGAASAAASPAISARSTRPWAERRPASARASSSRSLTSRLIRREERSAESTTSRSSAWSAPPSDACSSSRLASTLVSGVRSSCEASATNSRCCCSAVLPLGPGAVQRAQHLLQRLRQFADLVFDRRVGHVLGGVAGFGDLFGARGEGGDRAHRAARDRHPGEAGEQGAAEDPGADQEPDPVDRVFAVGGAAPVLDVAGGDAFGLQGNGLDPQPVAFDGARFERAELGGVRFFGAGISGPGQFAAAAVEDPDRGVVGEDVGSEFVRLDHPFAVQRVVADPQFALEDFDRAVHLVVEVVADPRGGDLADRAAEDHQDRQRQPGGDGGDPPADRPGAGMHDSPQPGSGVVAGGADHQSLRT